MNTISDVTVRRHWYIYCLKLY